MGEIMKARTLTAIVAATALTLGACSEAEDLVDEGTDVVEDVVTDEDAETSEDSGDDTVSYTHLTLPTICSV